jgi:hypothetical protein
VPAPTAGGPPSAQGERERHPPDAIERQLAHVESNRVRATYNKALMVEERRQIMQTWGDYLAMAEAENVIPLRTGVARVRRRSRRPRRAYHVRS